MLKLPLSAMQNQPQANSNQSSNSNVSPLNLNSKESYHIKNASLDSSSTKFKGLNPVSPRESDNTGTATISSLLSKSTTDDATNTLSGIIQPGSSAKSCSLSRGSSPLRKKIGTDHSGMRRKSPVISRKTVSSIPDTYNTPTTSRSRHQPSQEDEQSVMEEKEAENKGCSVSFNGSSDILGVAESGATPLKGSNDGDDPDSSGMLFSPPNQQLKMKEFLDQINQKIQKTTELIEGEQRVRDDNVNEYLKLSNNADRQQLARIKTVFEKKNQKSAVMIQHLQKKLENYHRKKKEAEQFGVPGHRQPKEVLRDVGHGLKSVGGNIRDGITGLSGKGLIGKPKEIAYLIKNKFGSADNIKELGDDNKAEGRSHHGSATLPPNSGLHPTTSSIQLSSTKTPISSGTMGSSGGGGGSSGGGKLESEEGSDCNSSMTSESISGAANQLLPSFASPHDTGMAPFETSIGGSFMDGILLEMKERQDENSRLREDIELIKQTLTSEENHMYDLLMEEKLRYERLEEQVNDLTELHQNEMENLKTGLKDIENMEEKVQYKNEENIKDLYEMVDAIQAKISRMEHQQAQQQQQFLTLEGLENSNARILFVKLINILLIFLQVMLLVVATVAGILTPLLQTKARLMVTVMLCCFFILLYVQLTEIRGCWQSFVGWIANALS